VVLAITTGKKKVPVVCVFQHWSPMNVTSR
jgi:hypothetical protein